MTAPDEDLVEIAVAVVEGDIPRERLEDFLYYWHVEADTARILSNETLCRLINRMAGGLREFWNQ